MRRLFLVLPLLALVAACGSAASVAASSSAPAPATSPPATRSSAPRTTTAPRTLHRSVSRAALPPFHAGATTVTSADLGPTWHAGCPVAPSQLRALILSYYGFDGAAHTGHLVVNAAYVSAVEDAFARMYAARFPIRQMVTVDHFGGSDERSVAADNTAGFNCRAAVTAGGGSSWSMHAYGEAIDVDPVENPYLYGGTVDPPSGAAYVNRSNHRPGMAYAGSPVNTAFAAVGWRWGASFDDYQHFSTNGR